MSQPTLLDPSAVDHLFRDSFLHTGEDEADAVLVAGIIRSYQMSRVHLDENRPAISSLLDELPAFFYRLEGAPFAWACFDRHQRLWTGDQHTMEQLFVLGIGIGRVRVCQPGSDGLPSYAIAQAE